MTSHGDNTSGVFLPGHNDARTFRPGENPSSEFPPGDNSKVLAKNGTTKGEVSSGKRRGVGGRPPKGTAERRTTKYTVAVNEAEKVAIEGAAMAAGLAPAVYLREVGIGSRLLKRADDVLYHRLSRIGVRIQQLARRAGDEGRAQEQAALESLLRDVIDARATL